MELRLATDADAGFIAEVLTTPQAIDMVLPHTAAEAIESIANPDHVYFLAEAAGRSVGVVLLAGLQNPHRSIELRKVAVATVGQGHGTFIMAASLDEAFNTYGAHRVWLDVYPENERAHALYLKLGFREDGMFREAYKHGDQYRSALLMSILASEHQAASAG